MTEAELAAAADAGPSLPAQGAETPVAAESLSGGDLMSVAGSSQAALQTLQVHPAHTASDNTSAEAGINKLFTTTEPLSEFLKLVASWSARRNVQLAVSRLAGEKNVWADELSRSKLQRFARRMADRERIPLDMLASPQGVVTLHPLHEHGHSLS